jgi:Chromatin assembly factor 1 subunit A.
MYDLADYVVIKPEECSLWMIFNYDCSYLQTFFDYEVDSDDEWEEEEPGESLHGSDDEKESEDEYEVDNEFFVPHGYLSDEETVGEKDEDQVLC